MVMVKSCGQTIQGMKENTMKARNMVRDVMSGLMEASMMVIGMRTE
jgi:hypothetical protein